jgi:hypothetical protein
MDLSACYDLISTESHVRKFLLVKYPKKPSMDFPLLHSRKLYRMLIANSLPTAEVKPELWIHYLITVC